MVGRLVLICVIAIVPPGGCKSNNIKSDRSETAQSGVCTAVVDFLRDQDLPELESVEVWQNDYGPGLKLTTAHYEIRTTLTEPLMLRRMPGFVESAYRAYNHQLPDPVETNVRFVVYLFADRVQWEDFTRNFAGEQAEIFCRIQAGAYYHQDACVAYDIGPDRTFSVLGHEGWHQFNDRHFKFRLPSWLDEGVAMLFEAQSSEDGSFDFQPAKNAYRLNSLRKTLDAEAMMPLEQLIATTPGDVLATDQTEAVMAFYSQSFAFARFLREAPSTRSMPSRPARAGVPSEVEGPLPSTRSGAVPGLRAQVHLGTAGAASRAPARDLPEEGRLATYRKLLADGLHGDWPLDEVSRKIAADRTVPRNVLWNHIVSLVLFHEYIGDDFEPVEQEYLAFCREITNQ